MGACFSRRAAPHAAPDSAAPPSYTASLGVAPPAYEEKALTLTQLLEAISVARWPFDKMYILNHLERNTREAIKQHTDIQALLAPIFNRSFVEQTMLDERAVRAVLAKHHDNFTAELDVKVRDIRSMLVSKHEVSFVAETLEGLARTRARHVGQYPMLSYYDYAGTRMAYDVILADLNSAILANTAV